MNRTLTILTAVVALAVPASAASAAVSNTPATQRPATAKLHVMTTVKSNGIIMRDGGVCDPIRHMGC